MEFHPPRYPRITINPDVCGGKPCISGIRFPVTTLLDYLAGGMNVEQLLRDFSFLEKEDVLAAMSFAVSK